MSDIRTDVVSFARSLAGLSADPSQPWRDEYLDTVAPNESLANAAAMATMSGCALVCRGILRRFIAHPITDRVYRPGHAMSDLVQIGVDARALRHPNAAPEPGDIVIVGTGREEHAWTCLTVTADPYDAGGLLIEGLDGGQVEGGYQCVHVRAHEVRGGVDVTESYRRRVVYVIDVEKVVARFGR